MTNLVFFNLQLARQVSVAGSELWNGQLMLSSHLFTVVQVSTQFLICLREHLNIPLQRLPSY